MSSFPRVLVSGTVTLLLVALPGAAGAGAGTRTVTDADDTRGRLDVTSATHGHDGRALLHTVRMQRRWASSLLDDGEVTLQFRINGRFRTLDVHHRDGRLVGRICTEAAAGDVSSCSRQVGLSRPDRRTLSVTLASRQLGPALSSYSWQVVTLLDNGEGRCPDTVCLDQLPDDGAWVKHRL